MLLAVCEQLLTAAPTGCATIPRTLTAINLGKAILARSVIWIGEASDADNGNEKVSEGFPSFWWDARRCRYPANWINPTQRRSVAMFDLIGCHAAGIR